MPRSGEDARRRLRQAALELFLERGYDAVTAAEIAARAGVTERTLFRHFKDKREVLFDGEQAFLDGLAAGVAAAPPETDPLNTVLAALGSLQPMLEEYRAFSEPRHRIISVTPALRERMLSKSAAMIETLGAALQRRGASPGVSVMAAQMGAAIFGRAMQAWFEDGKTGLSTHLHRAAQDLRGLFANAG